MSAFVSGKRFCCCLFSKNIHREIKYLRRLSTKSQISNPVLNKSLKKDIVTSVSSEGGLSSFEWMSKYGPKYMIRGEQVQVITEPDQFYHVLKLKTRKAKKRIALASLYLGTGTLEKELVSCIDEACTEASVSKNSDFEVNILLDYTRGSRGNVNSRTMLYPLLAQHDECVNVSLYHTPDLRGILKKLVPDKFNETIGLTHIKLYLFDDSLIITGANLSNDYFTNRQDRYILFNDCPELADFFNNLIKVIMSFSLSLKADGTTRIDPEWKFHPYEGNIKQFKKAAHFKIESILNQNKISERRNSVTTKDSMQPDTAVYPLLQMGPLGISRDEYALLDLLKSSQPNEDILLASGYFNLTNDCMETIVDQSKAKFSILMASPQANGFLGAKGIAGAIPYSYIYLAHLFMKRVESKKQQQRISMVEYSRDRWTFHGKGLWYYLPSQSLPTLTLVGSPNYGYRSVHKDLECEVAIVTENKGLQEQLREEHVQMYSSSSEVTKSTFQRRDRYVPLWIKSVTSFLKHFF